MELGRLQCDDDEEDGDDREQRDQDFLQHGISSSLCDSAPESNAPASLL
jgi:hypothetical protein